MSQKNAEVAVQALNRVVDAGSSDHAEERAALGHIEHLGRDPLEPSVAWGHGRIRDRRGQVTGTEEDQLGRGSVPELAVKNGDVDPVLNVDRGAQGARELELVAVLFPLVKAVAERALACADERVEPGAAPGLERCDAPRPCERRLVGDEQAPQRIAWS